MALIIRRFVLLAIFLGLLLGGLFGLKFHQQRQMQATLGTAPPPATVAVTTVERSSWQPFLQSVGSLVAVQGVLVANEVPGIVESLAFTSGSRVEKGDLLVRLDERVDRAQLAGLIAESRLTKVEFDRLAKLLNNKSVSRSDYDQAEAALDNARAQVEAKRQLIEKKEIKAPFSGVLGIRRVDAGQYLKEGYEIVSLQSLDPIHLDFSVPEGDLPLLHMDQPVQASVKAWPGISFEGRVTAIEPRVEETTRNLRVRATIANPGEKLRPGMFARVRVILPLEESVLTLPRTAITYTPYGDSVFVLEGDADQLSVRRIQVKTGEAREGRIRVVEGLSEGDRVVSAGQVKLRNGQSVAIDNSVVLEPGVSGS